MVTATITTGEALKRALDCLQNADEELWQARKSTAIGSAERDAVENARLQLGPLQEYVRLLYQRLQ